MAGGVAAYNATALNRGSKIVRLSDEMSSEELVGKTLWRNGGTEVQAVRGPSIESYGRSGSEQTGRSLADMKLLRQGSVGLSCKGLGSW